MSSRLAQPLYFSTEVIGHLVVRKRHERLDVMNAQAVEDAVVEGETGLVGLGVVAVGEDAAPEMDMRNMLKPISANSAMSSS